MNITLYNKDSVSQDIEQQYKCVTFWWYELSPLKELNILNREYERGWKFSHKTRNGIIFTSFTFFFTKF